MAGNLNEKLYAELKWKPLPVKVARHIPGGINRLNDIGCGFYYLSGYNKKSGDWTDGGFFPYLDYCMEHGTHVIDISNKLWVKVKTAV
jgi:hypothetical protein